MSFHRTLRVPEDGREYPLPASLGWFPIHRVEDFRDRVPQEWRNANGYFIPMYQKEAMFIQFDGEDWSPAIAKVGVGGINAVTGEVLEEAISEHKQDYLVVPLQKWLDGIKSGEGFVSQFVAMPLGQGYTIEAQLTDEENVGGIQISLIESRKGRFERIPEKRFTVSDAGEGSKDTSPDIRFSIAPPSPGSNGEQDKASMGIAAGGRIKQSILKDEYGIDSWDPSTTLRISLHIVNSKLYKLITGIAPPSSPITPEHYVRAGIPWFEYPETVIPGLAKATKFQRVLTLERVASARGEGTLTSEVSRLFDRLFQKASPRNATSLRKAAALCFKRKNWTKATKLITDIIRVCDDADETDYLLRAICQYNTGNFAASQRDASAVLLARPGHPHALFWHGMSSLALGFPQIALSNAEEIFSSSEDIELAISLEKRALESIAF